MRTRRFGHVSSLGLGLLIISTAVGVRAAPVPDKGAVALEPLSDAHFALGGFVGDRVEANVTHWLLVAPQNNPGLLDMFARRDAGHPIDLVPWAGEFVGKYLISGVQALRMSNNPQLKLTLQQVVDRLIALQAEDGYLGPWPKAQRLRSQWDLWGHYHILLGLILWHEHTGDQRAWTAAQRIADVVCNTCLDTNFRVFDAGSHEMNMGIIHGLTQLYRRTGNPRHLRMAQEVLQDFERAGDYFRTGLAGQEYYRTPRPRWESLHSLQGLTDLYRITGDDRFRRALLQHWASIRRFDLRNSGAFSSGEQATGNPYVNDAIETCCVVAWQAVMIDALQLTGDPTIADDLELATLNAILGSQHPSGAWCTYNTPLAGQRVPSHVEIRFQARADTPHLNCCSVNGPRGYGMISEWGVMRTRDGLALNYFGAMEARLKLGAGTAVTLRQRTDYPRDGNGELEVEPAEATEFTLALRIPAWAETPGAAVNGQTVADVKPGTYLKLRRRWTPGDRVAFRFGLGLRYEAGDLQQSGRVSLYRGPILLAADSRCHYPDRIPAIDVTRLGEARTVPSTIPAWLAVEVPAVDGSRVRLIDFASAGATTVEGRPQSRYQTWLPAKNTRPPRPVAWQPADGSAIGPGTLRFTWRRQAPDVMASGRCAVVVADSPAFAREVLRFSEQAGGRITVPASEAAKLRPHQVYYWKLVAQNQHGQAESVAPYKSFRIDPAAPPLPEGGLYGERPTDSMITAVPLRGDVKPAYGMLLDARGWKAAPGPDGRADGAIQLDGKGGMVRYKLAGEFPEQDYSVSVWYSVVELPKTHYGQIFCAWTAGMDDPLRVFVSGGKLAARIEASRSYDTQAAPVEVGRWYHVAAVKQQDKLTLYVDGHAISTVAAPPWVATRASDFALGGNPHFGGPEFLAARLCDLRFLARALSAEEVRKWHQNASPTRK
jgi:DUF1680 family protein